MWGQEVIFKSSNKNDDGSAFAALSNGDTQLVGNGLAKMIATNKVALGTTANKYGYRCDGERLYIVFKFDGETDLTIKHNANSTGERYMSLYSFSSTKALKDIASTDWGEKEQVPFASLVSPEGWEGGATSTVTTADYKKWSYSKKGCLNVVWENLPAGYYVLYGTGSEAYIYGFEANITPSAPAATYSVTYNLNGVDGTVPTQEDVAEGTEITLAAAPTAPAGQEFAGWSDGTNTYNAGDTYTMGAAPVTFTAQWQAETTKYDVTYNLNGGTGTAPMQPSVAEGTTITLAAAPTWEGYRFDGWLVKDENGNDVTVADGKFTMPAAKVAITAQWVKVWTVTFNTNGGSTIASVVVDDNGTLTTPTAPTKDCYAFGEWQKDGVAFDFATAIISDITLTATWAPKYATSLDFAAITTASTTGDNPIVDFLASGNMVASNLGGSEWETSTSKSGYVGYKLKNTGATITFLVQGSKRVKITFGSIGANVTLKKGEESVTISAASGDNAETVYPAFDVATDMLITLTTTSGSTVTLKSITIGEIPLISDDATLKDLKVNGTTIAGFNSATGSYYVEMPYGTQKADLPLVTATANHAAATVIVQDAKDRPDDTRATIKVTAEDGTTIKHYYVYFTNAAKEGVNLVKATIGDKSITLVVNESYIKSAIVENSGVNGRDGGVSAGSKFQKNSYIKIEMPAGQQFKANDIVDLEVTAIGGTYKLLVYSENSTAAEKLVVDEVTAPTLVVGHNKVQLNKDAQALYLVRDDSNGWNPHVKSIIVQRYMAPFVESFVIGEAEGTIDQANKTITLEVPASADVTALEPTIVAWANGGAKVSPISAQNFTIPVVYSVASAYAEDGNTEYTVTVTQAVPSADATLKTLTINGSALALVNGVYEYDYELPYGTTTAPVVVVEANDANATAVVTSVSLTEAVITVTAENGATQEYVINFTVSRAISYVIYDGSVQTDIELSGIGVLTWELVEPNKTTATSITTTCEGKAYTNCVNVFASATESDKRYMTIIIPDGYMAKFYLAGATNSNGDERSLFISKEITSTLDQSIAYSTSSAYAGAAMLSDYQMPGTYYLCCNKSIRLYELSVLLYPIDYARDVNAGRYGTICLPNKGQMIGAAVYEIAYMDYKDGAPYKIYFDEILNGKMEAGVPYVFLPNEGYNQLIVTYTAIFNAAAADANGLYGFIGASATDEYQIPSGVGNYIIQNNQYREVLAGADARIVSNRAYITLAEVPGYNDPLYVAPAPAPGRKRIAMGTTGAQVATGVDQVQGDEVPTKMIINGQLFILRGEKMYDAQGKLVR